MPRVGREAAGGTTQRDAPGPVEVADEPSSPPRHQLARRGRQPTAATAAAAGDIQVAPTAATAIRRRPGMVEHPSGGRRHAARRELGEHQVRQRRDRRPAAAQAGDAGAELVVVELCSWLAPGGKFVVIAVGDRWTASCCFAGASSSASALEVGAWERARGGHTCRAHGLGAYVRGDAGRAARWAAARSTCPILAASFLASYLYSRLRQ
jgi:hypothetical protein